RIAAQEIHQHLVPDARQDEIAEAAGLGDADPARCRLAGCRVPIPVETDLHPPIFVGEDFLALRPRYDRCLQTLNHRAGRELWWMDKRIGRKCLETHVEGGVVSL